jgi:pantoate--beta-alanine ligase
MPVLFDQLEQVSEQVAAWKQQGLRVAFVPTMGNLHKGHLQLCNTAQKHADKVIVSIYVNPLQFGENEDYASYPRTLEADQNALKSVGVDALFCPNEAVMYADGVAASTTVSVPKVAELWCGASRPGHFTGVTTVVCKLLNIVQPDVALFGEKDYQQLYIIRRMVHDLFIPVKIIGVPTQREESGLALSSRNQYLNKEERQRAAFIHELLMENKAQLTSGQRNFREMEQNAVEMLEKRGFRPDYYAICRVQDLQLATDPAETEWVILVAAHLGAARLIDNCVISLRNAV